MTRAPSSTRLSRFIPVGLFILVIVVLIATVLYGGPDDIDGTYGQRKGVAWESVNGTGVLAGMFEQAGHTVFSWRMLSPRLYRRADCIVWFPDDFKPPSQKVCDWLEGWLTDEPNRTLIYVGRDFDAALWYWEEIQPNAPKEQRQEILRRKVEAKGVFSRNLLAPGTTEECKWFTLKGGQKHREVRSLDGNPQWIEGIDPAKLQIELNHRMIPSRDAEVLLESEGDLLVASKRFNGSRLVVVANGSFLLNLPLVNHEHRKLAGQLIEEVGPPGQTVVFLESGPAGLPVLESDPTAGPPSVLHIFNRWPTNWILLHLAAVGIIFCVSRFPIFGRPRDPEPEATSDFGRHIDAVAEFLQRSGASAHAAARLLHYHETTRPDSAASRSESAAAGSKQPAEPEPGTVATEN